MFNPIKLRLHLIVVTLFTLFTNCKKEETKPLSELLQGKWKISAEEICAPNTDFREENLERVNYNCANDDIYIYSARNTYLREDGDSTCATPSAFEPDSGSYFFDEKTMIVTATGKNGGAASIKILKLTSNFMIADMLRVVRTYNPNGSLKETGKLYQKFSRVE